jgi:peptide/nickel transport system ATP-binding protein
LAECAVGVIEVERLSVSYGAGTSRFDAVRAASFCVEKGEAFGLVGESGSGKSTVLRAIAGLVPASAGRIVLAGAEVDTRRNRAQRRLVQMVFQDPYGSLHPQHTLDQTLSEPLVVHRIGDAERRVGRALAEVGLGVEHRFRYPHQLSGGQRQRAAIARALILRPPILLLDEPTSALDVSIQAEILNLLSRLRRDHALTLLMVSHDLAVIAHLCDRIGVMTRGEIVEIASAERLSSGTASHPYTRALLLSDRRLSRAWQGAVNPAC